MRTELKDQEISGNERLSTRTSFKKGFDIILLYKQKPKQTSFEQRQPNTWVWGVTTF